MITTKLVIPNLQPAEDERELEKEVEEADRELEKSSRDLPSPGWTEKDGGDDRDAPSTTVAGSERPGERHAPSSTQPRASSTAHADASSDVDEKHADRHADRRAPGLSRSLLSQHDVMTSKPTPLEWIVVRIEVTDTGCGIRPKDMVQTKLFCERPCCRVVLLGAHGFRVAAFNQTEMGRQQGGKGTGLGLALVRQIVKRSGGRLGVRSKVNEGSTFWVELRTSLFRLGHQPLTSSCSTGRWQQGRSWFEHA